MSGFYLQIRDSLVAAQTGEGLPALELSRNLGNTLALACGLWSELPHTWLIRPSSSFCWACLLSADISCFCSGFMPRREPLTLTPETKVSSRAFSCAFLAFSSSFFLAASSRFLMVSMFLTVFWQETHKAPQQYRQ
jgi:hypothetical protein